MTFLIGRGPGKYIFHAVIAQKDGLSTRSKCGSIFKMSKTSQVNAVDCSIMYKIRMVMDAAICLSLSFRHNIFSSLRVECASNANWSAVIIDVDIDDEIKCMLD